MTEPKKFNLQFFSGGGADARMVEARRGEWMRRLDYEALERRYKGCHRVNKELAARVEELEGRVRECRDGHIIRKRLRSEARAENATRYGQAVVKQNDALRAEIQRLETLYAESLRVGEDRKAKIELLEEEVRQWEKDYKHICEQEGLV